MSSRLARCGQSAAMCRVWTTTRETRTSASTTQHHGVVLVLQAILLMHLLSSRPTQLAPAA